MQIPRFLRNPLVAVALALGGIGATLTGCAAFASLTAAIPMVSEIVSDGETILAMIETGVQAYFAAHPSASQTAILNALTRTRQALVAGGQALAGVQNVTAGQEAAAFGDFAAAYADLLALVAPIGIAPAQPVTVLPTVVADAGAADGGARVAAVAAPSMLVPTPLALKAVRGSR